MSNNNNGNYGMIDPITNAIGMAYNIGTGIFNSVQNYRNNQWNQRFAREQFDYQKDLNQILMDREDNAVQRRAKDLQAAGISKNLAAGSPAQAATMSAGNSGAVANSNMQTQQLQKMDIMNGYAQYQMVMAEKELKNVQAIVEAKREGLIDEQTATERINQIVGQAQARNLDADTELKGKQGRNVDKDTELKGTQIDRNRHDLGIDKKRGTKQNETENNILTSVKSFDSDLVEFINTLINRRDNSVEFDSGLSKYEVKNESDLLKVFSLYCKEVYEKYGTLSSSKAQNAIYDNFYRAFYSVIPGPKTRDKNKWIQDNLKKVVW